jgi:predicted transcriptional regulator YdeE
MAVAALDKKAMAKNLLLVKTALKRASKKGVRVGFAFAPGKDKASHILMIDPRKNAKAVMAELVKAHKDHKQVCCGTATVIIENGKKTVSIIYVKKLAGAERKMMEALKVMGLRYAVALETEDELEDIKEAAEELEEAVDEVLDDEDDAEADDDDEASADDEETDESAEGASDSEDDRREDDRGDTDDAHDQAVAAEDEAPAPAAAAPPPPAAAKLAAIGAAPQIWTQTRSVMSKSIDQLSEAIRREYASESPEILADIEKGMAKMSEVTARFDHRLAEAMERAHKAQDEAARKAELARAKAILAEHIKYVQSEPLIAHIDANPFGVQTNLKKVLTASLTHMAKVVS